MRKLNNVKIARELLLIAQEVTAFQEEGELSFAKELQMIKDMKAFKDFFKDLVKFKGSLNDFVNNLGSMAENKSALAEFREMADFLHLSNFFNDKKIMQHAKMNDSEIKNKIEKVYKADK